MKTLLVQGPAEIKFYRTTTKEDGTSGAERVETFTLGKGDEYEVKYENHTNSDHLMIDGEEGYIFDNNGFELI